MSLESPLDEDLPQQHEQMLGELLHLRLLTPRHHVRRRDRMDPQRLPRLGHPRRDSPAEPTRTRVPLGLRARGAARRRGRRRRRDRSPYPRRRSASPPLDRPGLSSSRAAVSEQRSCQMVRRLQNTRLNPCEVLHGLADHAMSPAQTDGAVRPTPSATPSAPACVIRPSFSHRKGLHPPRTLNLRWCNRSERSAASMLPTGR